MRDHGVWLAAIVTFLITLTGSADASTGTRVPVDAIERGENVIAADGWWTCIIERPKFYYIGWGPLRADAVMEAIKACKSDDLVCLPEEADCYQSEDRR